MVSKPAIAAALLAGAILVAPRWTAACSPPRDPESPPCLFVELWTPAQSFPRDLHGALRVGTFDRVGQVLSPHATFDPDVEVAIHRAVADGYEPVAFTLVPQPGLVPNALHIELADPAPGEYVVSSPDVTCTADPSPTGTGFQVGAFELEPSVALPTALGSVRWLGVQMTTEVVDAADESCGTTEVTTRVARSTIELQLDDSALPWSDVIDTSIYVDGEVYRGFSRLPVSGAGVATFELTRTCASSRPDLVATHDRFGPGAHTIRIGGKIEDLAAIDSDETTFELGCGDTDDQEFGGCAAGGGAGPALMFIVIGVVVRTQTRKRRE